jgi:cytochrome c oxidase subunit 2
MNIPISPEQASSFAFSVDLYFYMLVVLCSVLTIGIFMTMIFLAIKFRKIEGEDRPSVPLENMALEITWTVIPFVILLGLFFWSTYIYGYYLKGAPEESLQIDVIGKQWMWKVQHPNGKREVNDLHVPVNVPIKISMTSQDVLHDYFIPAFRVKQDVVPGRVTELWFEPTKKGQYHIFCAEYCGTEHSYMNGTVTVLSHEDYERWLSGALPSSGANGGVVMTGEKLFTSKGCVTCHSGLKGAQGPSLTGIFGTEGMTTEGESFMRDEDYIRESILQPQVLIVDGFTPLMQSFEGQLSAEEVNLLVDYVKNK